VLGKTFCKVGKQCNVQQVQEEFKSAGLTLIRVPLYNLTIRIHPLERHGLSEESTRHGMPGRFTSGYGRHDEYPSRQRKPDILGD
jgi:hypothetical protein